MFNSCNCFQVETQRKVKEAAAVAAVATATSADQVEHRHQQVGSCLAHIAYFCGACLPLALAGFEQQYIMRSAFDES